MINESTDDDVVRRSIGRSAILRWSQSNPLPPKMSETEQRTRRFGSSLENESLSTVMANKFRNWSINTHVFSQNIARRIETLVANLHNVIMYRHLMT